MEVEGKEVEVFEAWAKGGKCVGGRGKRCRRKR